MNTIKKSNVNIN